MRAKRYKNRDTPGEAALPWVMVYQRGCTKCTLRDDTEMRVYGVRPRVMRAGGIKKLWHAMEGGPTMDDGLLKMVHRVHPTVGGADRIGPPEE